MGDMKQWPSNGGYMGDMKQWPSNGGYMSDMNMMTFKWWLHG